VRILIRNLQRERLFTAHVDNKDPASVVRPPDGEGPEVYLNWDGARDDHGHLRHCPVCGCRELFKRKDFPQITGFVIVVLAAVIAMVLFGMRRVLAGIIVLGTVALVDLLIFFFTGRCLVCYRCRSEFRDVPISRDQRGWDLATGEKYRLTEPASAAPPESPPPAAPQDPKA
jgi:hypothetical protein